MCHLQIFDTDHGALLAMGQNPAPSVNIPIPTKIGMGGAPNPKYGIPLVLTHSLLAGSFIPSGPSPPGPRAPADGQPGPPVPPGRVRLVEAAGLGRARVPSLWLPFETTRKSGTLKTSHMGGECLLRPTIFCGAIWTPCSAFVLLRIQKGTQIGHPPLVYKVTSKLPRWLHGKQPPRVILTALGSNPYGL